MTGRLRSAFLTALVLVAAVTLPGCDDAPSGPREVCGSVLCPAGQLCCNESCGICVPPGGACIELACSHTPCATDGDCRLYSDTCGGCVCRALHRTDPDPTCPSPPNACLVDPCLGRSVVCDPASRRCQPR